MHYASNLEEKYKIIRQNKNHNNICSIDNKINDN